MFFFGDQEAVKHQSRDVFVECDKRANSSSMAFRSIEKSTLVTLFRKMRFEVNFLSR